MAAWKGFLHVLDMAGTSAVVAMESLQDRRMDVTYSTFHKARGLWRHLVEELVDEMREATSVKWITTKITALKSRQYATLHVFHPQMGKIPQEKRMFLSLFHILSRLAHVPAHAYHTPLPETEDTVEWLLRMVPPDHLSVNTANWKAPTYDYPYQCDTHWPPVSQMLQSPFWKSEEHAAKRVYLGKAPVAVVRSATGSEDVQKMTAGKGSQERFCYFLPAKHPDVPELLPELRDISGSIISVSWEDKGMSLLLGSQFACKMFSLG